MHRHGRAAFQAQASNCANSLASVPARNYPLGHVGQLDRKVPRRQRLRWVGAAVSRYKRVIGDALRSRTGRRQATEVAIAVQALNRMLEFGRPESVRVA